MSGVMQWLWHRGCQRAVGRWCLLALLSLGPAGWAAESPPEATAMLRAGRPTLRVPSDYRSLIDAGSYWEGEATLHGRKWRVGALTPGRSVQAMPVWWLLQAVDTAPEQTHPAWVFSQANGLWLDGHGYRLQTQLEGAGAAGQWRVVFRETHPVLAEVSVEGQDIERLQWEGEWTVLVEKPGTKLRLPAAKYQSTAITLAKSNSPARFVSRQYQVTEFAAQLTNVVRGGGPLTNYVTVFQRGRTLSLEYELVDGARHAYRPEDLSLAPRFEIRAQGRTVGAGSFEFG